MPAAAVAAAAAVRSKVAAGKAAPMGKPAVPPPGAAARLAAVAAAPAVLAAAQAQVRGRCCDDHIQRTHAVMRSLDEQSGRTYSRLLMDGLMLCNRLVAPSWANIRCHTVFSLPCRPHSRLHRRLRLRCMPTRCGTLCMFALLQIACGVLSQHPDAAALC